MKTLMRKELRLALHPAGLAFLALSAMVLIPSYSYYVIFFYTELGIFFTCLSGRENQDVLYTILLPVSRKQLAASRIGLAMVLELLQVLAVAIFSLLRRYLPIPPNSAGMEANLALTGLSLAMLALSHLVFFSVYYRDVRRVGVAFVWSSAVTFLYIAAAEIMAHTVLFVRDRLDTPDPAFLSEKLVVLTGGILLYCLFTVISLHRSVRLFEKQDL